MNRTVLLSLSFLVAIEFAVGEESAQSSNEAQNEVLSVPGRQKESCPMDAQRYIVTGMFTKPIDPKQREEEAKRRREASDKTFKLIAEAEGKPDSELFKKVASEDHTYDPTFSLLPWIAQERDRLLQTLNLDCPENVGLFVDRKRRSLTRSFGKVYRLPYQEQGRVCCANATEQVLVVIDQEKKEVPVMPLKSPRELGVTVEEMLTLDAID